MPSLEIEFTGLCLLVPDAAGRAVHVLMPAVPNHGGSDPYVARLLASGLAEPAGRSIDGWSLELGKSSRRPDTTLRPDAPTQGRILDLSALTGRRVPRRLLSGERLPELTARITLRAGKVVEVNARSRWLVRGREIILAHGLTWRIADAANDLAWASMGADGPLPLRSLAELEPATGGPLRIRIFHGPARALPAGEDVEPGEVERGLQACYRLLGIENPDREFLPSLIGQAGGRVNPILAMALPGDEDLERDRERNKRS